MPQTPLGFDFEQTDAIDDKVTAWSGLTLVYEALMAMGVMDSVRKRLRLFRSRRNLQFDEAEHIAALVLLFSAGGESFDDLQAIREDKALSRLLERSLPAPETSRQFMYQFHEEALVEKAKQAVPSGKKAYVPEESAPLRALGDVVRDLTCSFHKRWPKQTATLDIDATFQESHKREAKDHYQDGPGYNPLLATWVEQNLVVFDQFRDGNVPDHFDVLKSVQAAFAALPETVKERRLRADSAMYVVELFRWLCAERIEFAIGARIRDTLLAACKAVAETDWQHLQTRADSVLHLNELTYRPNDWNENDGALRYIAIRLTPIQSELFDEPRSVKFLSVVTNRTDLTPAELVRWYWEKGGTIEHVHDMLKNELGAGLFPCGRFGSNAAWLRLNVLTYNVMEVLRRIGPEEFKTARPKRLRLHLLAIPALVVDHARKLMARVAERGRHLLKSRGMLWDAVPT